MRNSAELRRFPSSHPSLFSGFFWIFLGQMRGGNEGEALYRRPDPVARGGATGPPCRPQEGRPAPLAGPLACRPWGATGPLFFFSRDFVANLKKKITFKACRPHRAIGVYFWKFPKQTYIFEILFFFKYKKEKNAADGGTWNWPSRRRPGPAHADGLPRSISLSLPHPTSSSSWFRPVRGGDGYASHKVIIFFPIQTCTNLLRFNWILVHTKINTLLSIYTCVVCTCTCNMQKRQIFLLHLHANMLKI